MPSLEPPVIEDRHQGSWTKIATTRRVRFAIPLACLTVLWQKPARPAGVPDQKTDGKVPDGSLEGKVKAIVEDRMARYQLPGVSVAVVIGGQVALAKGYGWADLDRRVPANPNTRWKLESVTKQFTASAIMVLHQQGIIDLNASIREYLPDTPLSWSGITVHHLLSHTAGLADDFPDEGTLPPPSEQESDRALGKRFLSGIFDQCLAFRPGYDWRYSNDGYFLLAAIVARKARPHAWSQFLKSEFFDPLQMRDTDIDHGPAADGLAQGYVMHRQMALPVDARPLIGCAGLHSTVVDLAKWDAALYSTKPLTTRSKEAMWTPVKLENGCVKPYGYGWGIERSDDHLVVSHGGLGDGFNTSMRRYVDDRVTVIVLTNMELLFSHPDDPADDIACRIADACIPRLAKAPVRRNPVLAPSRSRKH